MLADTFAMPAARRRHGDALAFAAGTFVLATIAFVALIDLWWGLTLNGYSYIADTISDLAAGSGSWTMDLALTTYAAAVAVTGLSLWRWPGSRTNGAVRHGIGCAIVVALGPVIWFIAAHDAYGDRETGGFVIHRDLVYALGLGFPLAAWLLAPSFDAVSRVWRNASLLIAIAWALAAPYFTFMVTTWDGIYERGLALLLLAWFAVAAWNLVRRGRGLV